MLFEEPGLVSLSSGGSNAVLFVEQFY